MGARECREINPSNPPWRWLAVVAVLPGLLAVFQLGRLHPDEVFQYLEPAYFRAFGYGVRAWEWETGLRNWAIPGVLSVLLQACAAAGIDDPWKRRAVLEVPQAALHLWMLLAVYRFAARRVNADLARWSIPLVGLYMPILTFAGRTLGESFSAAFIVIGLEALDREDGKSQSALEGGAVLGLSVVARYGSAAAVIGAMVFLLARRRWRDFAFASGGGLIVALLLGALDQATWGAPFHSLRTYLDFNVFSGQAAAKFGQDPFTVYLPYLAMLAPWASLGLLAAVKTKRAPAGIFMAAGLTYLLAIFITAHKEPRFIYPALIVLSVGALPCAFALLEKWGLAATALACVASLTFFTFSNQLRPERPEQFRLQAKAWPAATGFFMLPEGIWGSGGNFWLGKNLPWFTCDFPQQFQHVIPDQRFNRVVNWDKQGDAELKAAGFSVLETDGHATLYGR